MKKIIFPALILFCAAASMQAAAQSSDDRGVGPYLAKLHENAARVESWAASARDGEEAVKTAELEAKSTELKALLSVMDGEAGKGDQLDPAAFNTANDRFQQVFREADVIAAMDESAAAEMKKNRDEELLNSGIRGAYSTEPLTYDSFTDSSAYADPSGNEYLEPEQIFEGEEND